MAKKKTNQEELPNMPEMDALGKAATEFLNKRDALRESQDELDESKNELVKQFKETGKKSLKIAGYTLNYRHQAKDAIAVVTER